jgi:hypothetical protein
MTDIGSNVSIGSRLRDVVTLPSLSSSIST